MHELEQQERQRLQNLLVEFDKTLPKVDYELPIKGEHDQIEQLENILSNFNVY